MPQIELTIDEQGNLSAAHIKGIQGPGCEQVQKLLEQLLGAASKAERTPEYHARAVTQQRIQRR